MVTTSVRGRVGDDITRSQDDDSNLHLYTSGIKFWCESLGEVASKAENLVFYKHGTAALFAEGFAEKFLFLEVFKRA